MRKRAEDESSRRQVSRRSVDKLDATRPDARCLAALVLGGSECEVKARVLQQQGAELATSVPASAKHPNGDSIHIECIIIQTPWVNARWANRLDTPDSDKRPLNRNDAKDESAAGDSRGH